MLKEFKKFILRGNAVDLAVGVVIGAAFGAVVNALVKDIFTPLIAAIAGKADFSGLYFTVNNSKFMYGDVINAIISLITIAAVIFFLVVQPINKLMAISARRKGEPESNTRECPECLSDIPKKASRCMYCTTKVKPQK
jgi:large conductance mechanosensitive channel